MNILTKDGAEIFRGDDAQSCLREIVRLEGYGYTVAAAVQRYEIRSWVCPGHQIVNGACVKCDFRSQP